MRLIMCHTDGCPCNGVPVMWNKDQALLDAQDAGATLADPWCGGCSQQITDIRDATGGNN